MKRASARSKSLTSTPRRRCATWSTACTTMSASRRLTPAMRSRIAACSHGVEPAGGAEVDEREATVGEQHHVARVRIGVEHAVLQHLLEERAQQVVGELLRGRRRWPSAQTTSRTLVPSSHSITSTRDVLSSS